MSEKMPPLPAWTPEDEERTRAMMDADPSTITKDAMTPDTRMVTDAEAAEWPKYVPGVRLVLAVEQVDRLLADRNELWAFVKLVRDTGAQHCMPLAEKLLERKEAHGE